LLAGLRRLWLLPIAVATAFLLSLPFGGDHGFSHNTLIVLEVIYATAIFTFVLTAILTPGAAVHTLLIRELEVRRFSFVARASVGVATSPLMGGWYFLVVDGDDDLAAWLAYFGSMVLFACASVWYGSRHSSPAEGRSSGGRPLPAPQPRRR
jgi:hypothetical protein